MRYQVRASLIRWLCIPWRARKRKLAEPSYMLEMQSDNKESLAASVSPEIIAGVLGAIQRQCPGTVDEQRLHAFWILVRSAICLEPPSIRP
jgi:hypothetical protein